MPFGDFVNQLPPAFFIVVHMAAFLAAVYFAYRSFTAEASIFGWGFFAYAAAELVYMTYHIDWTVFLFAHTIAEVLDLAAFVLVFAGAAQHILAGRRAEI